MSRDTISGTFDRASLARLLWPIAWSGTVSAEQRRAEECALHALVHEARCSVELVGGQIVAVCGAADEEDEQ